MGCGTGLGIRAAETAAAAPPVCPALGKFACVLAPLGELRPIPTRCRVRARGLRLRQLPRTSSGARYPTSSGADPLVFLAIWLAALLMLASGRA